MLHIENGLQPLWDEYLTDTRNTDACLSANRPVKTGSVFRCDKPWEGSGSDFFNILKDGGLYRMYYLGWKVFDGDGIHVCYAESRDGLNWERPSLGLYEYRGSTDNNILFGPKDREWDNFFVMKDNNPACPEGMRYKATAAWEFGKSLMCLVSPDGIRFRPYRIISEGGLYDSVNTLHWDEHSGKYVLYFRGNHAKSDSHPEFAESCVRDVRVSESEDFEHWSEGRLLDFKGSEDYPLYTNCAGAYCRDSRYFIGFPTRYFERRGWTPSFERLGGKAFRLEHMKHSPRYGLAVTDCVFMSSRDRYSWTRFDEACIRPGPEQDYNWMYGDAYPAAGLIETPGRFDGEPNELTMLVEACHWDDRPTELMRYVWRLDGFASYKAGYKKKRLLTKLLTSGASALAMNFSTSARGSVYVRILDAQCDPIEGYTGCEQFGDSPERVIDFDRPLCELAGKPVRIEFTMSDAEIFALNFLPAR